MRRKKDRVLSAFDLRQPWIISLVLLACIPLFPEYVAPFLAVFALIAARRDAKKHHRRLRVGATGKAMIAYLSFATVQLIWVDDRVFSLITLICWFAMLCVYLSLATVLTTPRRMEAAMFALSSVVGVLGVMACVQYVLVGFCGFDTDVTMLWVEVDKAVYGLLPIRFNLGSGFNRSCATFTNPNLYAQFTVMMVPLMAAYGFSGRRSTAKILTRISLLIAVGGLLVSFSRGAYLALGAIAVVMCIANIRRLVPILMVVFSVVPLLPNSIYLRLFSMGNGSDVAIVERFELWGVGMLLFLKAPLLGHGFGVASTFEGIQQAGYYVCHVHNLFLQVLAEGGVVGLVLLLFLLWKLFRTGFELIIHAPKCRNYGAAVIAFCAGLCMCGMVDYPFFTPKTITVVMIMLGVTDALGFAEVKRPYCTVWQAIPFAATLHDRLEAWVQKKTAPKDEREES